MKKHGLYISLLPGEKIKRHLSSDFGEMPLPDTTIAEELITLTEYDDTSITNEIGKIHTLSHQVEEDITSQLPFRQRYGNFLMRLREKSPMWYTLLMTQFCDEVSKTPFSDWNEKQIAYFMVDGLYQPRGAEISVNIALSSLCEHDPEDFCDLNVKEDIIHQSTATVFFTLNETLDSQYLFRSAEQYYFLIQEIHLLGDSAIDPEDGQSDHIVVFIQYHQAMHLPACTDTFHQTCIKTRDQFEDPLHQCLFPILRFCWLQPGWEILADHIVDLTCLVHHHQLHCRGTKVNTSIKFQGTLFLRRSSKP